MTSLEEAAALSFRIIAAVGDARSSYIEAIQAAKTGDYEAAQACIERGDASYSEGHALHSDLIQREAAGDATTVCLMLMHAEDQLMSAEAFCILAQEFIDVYHRFDQTDE